MTNNDELSSLLEGSMITATIRDEDTVEIGFEDGTWLAVGTAADTPSPPSMVPTGGIIEAAHQSADKLELRLQGGESIQIETATTSAQPAVVVLNAAGGTDYAV